MDKINVPLKFDRNFKLHQYLVTAEFDGGEKSDFELFTAKYKLSRRECSDIVSKWSGKTVTNLTINNIVNTTVCKQFVANFI